MLKGKTVVLAVSGSIAAYKIASLASALGKLHADVQVLMTQNATNFINPITLETLTGNKCLVDTFDRNFQYSVEHVALAKRADVVLVAPASANVIGKIANGIADDMLTTTVMACKCKKIISPAMNTQMFENPIVQDNLKKLEHYGYEVIQPAVGLLACKDVGKGKMPEIDQEAAEKNMACTEAIIYSMTPEERRNPSLMNPSRKNRIARGAGVDIAEVNRLVKQFEQMKKMMKQMPGMMKKGKRRMFKGLPF